MILALICIGCGIAAGMVSRSWVYLRWAVESIGYRIRPYDMVADRRRWCWQPRTPCSRMLMGVQHVRR
jgi:hypothetical protein